MCRFAGLLAISGVLLALHTAAASAAPLETMDEVARALQTCWKPPARTEGSYVTLRFSFRRDGSIFGHPLPSQISVIGDEKARKRFIEAAIDAVERCAPLNFSSNLAPGIGGRVFTMRFASPRKTVQERYASAPNDLAIAHRPAVMLTSRHRRV